MKIFSKMTIAQLRQVDLEWTDIHDFSLVAEDNGLTSLEGAPGRVACLMEDLANCGTNLDEMFV
jgi:hypothetical protein